MFKLIINFFIVFFIATPAFAYLGPGLGGGVIAATLGLVFAIFAAFFGLIWFPVKKLIKDKKNKKKQYQNKVD